MILRLDLDGGRRPLGLARVCWLLRRASLRPVWLSQRRSPGGKGWHVEVQVRPAPRTAMEVTALQAALGSDPAREACNVNRARMVDRGKVSRWWRHRWNVLYGA